MLLAEPIELDIENEGNRIAVPRGNWVVEDKDAQALRYIRSENGNLPQAFVTVAGVFELDMARSPITASPQLFGVNAGPERRVA